MSFRYKESSLTFYMKFSSHGKDHWERFLRKVKIVCSICLSIYMFSFIVTIIPNTIEYLINNCHVEPRSVGCILYAKVNKILKALRINSCSLVQIRPRQQTPAANSPPVILNQRITGPPTNSLKPGSDRGPDLQNDQSGALSCCLEKKQINNIVKCCILLRSLASRVPSRTFLALIM